MTKSNRYDGGVSVIICCFNSSQRLKPTLDALSRQIISQAFCWELIVVDNASDDNTAEEAMRLWNELNDNQNIDFKIVTEPESGLANARRRGIKTARYRFLLFCDDDNWLSEDYIQVVFDTLNSDNKIAACGGRGVPVFEINKPFWFDHYAEAFAVGPQKNADKEGRLLNLYGAGMAINRDALLALEQNNFNPQMIGRKGKNLSSAEDTELTYAFVLLGYKLVYIDQITFFHFLPSARLEFPYLTKLFTAFGTDGPIRNLYNSHLTKSFLHKLVRNWNFHFILCLFRLVKYLVLPPKKYGRNIFIKWNLAYLKELLHLRKNYARINASISLLKNNSMNHRDRLPLGLKISSQKVSF